MRRTHCVAPNAPPGKMSRLYVDFWWDSVARKKSCRFWCDRTFTLVVLLASRYSPDCLWSFASTLTGFHNTASRNFFVRLRHIFCFGYLPPLASLHLVRKRFALRLMWTQHCSSGLKNKLVQRFQTHCVPNQYRVSLPNLQHSILCLDSSFNLFTANL